MSTHTPGPWWRKGLDVVSPDGLIFQTGEGYQSELEANATLGAAAPEMLRLLKWAEGVLACHIDVDANLLRQTRAAIAKATAGPCACGYTAAQGCDTLWHKENA